MKSYFVEIKFTYFNNYTVVIQEMLTEVFCVKEHYYHQATLKGLKTFIHIYIKNDKVNRKTQLTAKLGKGYI